MTACIANNRLRGGRDCCRDLPLFPQSPTRAAPGIAANAKVSPFYRREFFPSIKSGPDPDFAARPAGHLRHDGGIPVAFRSRHGG
jgi:hypothetical protein